MKSYTNNRILYHIQLIGVSFFSRSPTSGKATVRDRPEKWSSLSLLEQSVAPSPGDGCMSAVDILIIYDDFKKLLLLAICLMIIEEKSDSTFV